MTPLRIVQVGMGRWGRDWARLLSQHPELVQPVAYVDLAPAMLAQLQADNGVDAERCFLSLADALQAVDADAVLITTALGGHVPTALEALEAGKHVLVEKPFAPSLAEGRRAVELAARRDLTLMVSQNYRFFPAARTVAALIREGSLGPVGGVSIHFRKYANAAPPGTNWHYQLRQPLLEDMSIHHFDLMRFVLGQEPQVVTCQAWNPPWSNFRDPASAAAIIRFTGGVVVDYRGSWVSTGVPTLWSGDWQIECAEGVISWSSRDDSGTASDAVTIRMRGKRSRRVPLPELPYPDRVGVVAAFATAIRDRSEPQTSGRDNLGSLALMFAAIESAMCGLPQTLNTHPGTLSA